MRQELVFSGRPTGRASPLPSKPTQSEQTPRKGQNSPELHRAEARWRELEGAGAPSKKRTFMTMTTMTIQARGLQFTAEASSGRAPAPGAASGGGPPNGELVLLLHGFPQTRHTWRAELAALTDEGYCCCAFDQRGYSEGARPVAIDAYRTEEMVADAIAIASAIGFERFHLVGHDWGGQIAWCLAALQPERVKTLAVISRPHPAAFSHALVSDPAQAARSGHHRRFQSLDAADDLLADDAASLREMYIKWGGVPAADAQEYLSTLGEREALNAAINWYRAASDSAITAAQLPSVTMPTLYVWGTGDSTVGRIAAEGTKAMVDGPYEFVQLPDVGHFVTDEAPGVFTDLLLRHLATHR